MVKDYYKKNQSIESLVETIETKFNDFGVSQHDNNQLSSFEKLKLISKVANQGWYPNWNNTDEAKYFPYFEYKEGVFSFYTVAYRATFLTVPSALLYQSDDLAYFMGVYYFDLYEDYLN